MIKKSFRLMLLAAFALSSVMFVSCNKWEDEINELDSKVAALEQTVSSLKAAVDGGAVISSVSNTSDGVKFTLSNGQSYTVNHGAVGATGATGATGAAGQDGKDGQDGKPGSVVTIGENGNWFIDGVDQNVSAVGASTFVVDCGSYFELNVVEKVDGENSEIVKINLPKTRPITSLDVVGLGNLNMSYGATLAKDLKFNGVTYKEGTTLTSKNTVITAIVNPLDTDASLYDFVLVDSKGNSPFVISKVAKNVSENPLTRAEAEKTVNNGVWDLTVTYADGNFDTDDVNDRSHRAYALATTTANGLVSTGYDMSLVETKVTNPSVALKGSVNDAKKRTIDLSTVFAGNLDHVVDYFFEIGDKTRAASIGAELDGNTLTAVESGSVPMILNYLLVDGSVKEHTFTASFIYIAPTGDALASYTWTVQKDDSNKDNGVEKEYVFLPISAVKSALVGSNDAQMPGVKISAITWADGTELNKKSVVVNGKYYGADVKDKTVTKLKNEEIATVDQYTYVWDEDEEEYVKATNINDELYIKVKFNSQTALVGDYALTLDFVKNGADKDITYYSATIAVPFNLSIVAPENVIVKNAPYFNGDNAVVYGTADGKNASANLNSLFTTPGLEFNATKIKKTSSSKKADFFPWGANNEGVVVDGDITVPVKATGNANYCVGTTQEFTATKRLFPRVEEAAYTFTVTVKSPVVVSYNGTAKTINNDPITIDASEFTGKSMKDGSALYIGKVGNNVVDDKNYITSVTVAADTKDENSKYIKVLNDDKNDPNYNKFNTTVTYKDAEGNVLYTAAAVEVERVKGIALQSAVTCKVNVTVLDKWGVETVIPVNVTVNPIQ